MIVSLHPQQKAIRPGSMLKYLVEINYTIFCMKHTCTIQECAGFVSQMQLLARSARKRTISPSELLGRMLTRQGHREIRVLRWPLGWPLLHAVAAGCRGRATEPISGIPGRRSSITSARS
jgi:hypothetical protein